MASFNLAAKTDYWCNFGTPDLLPFTTLSVISHPSLQQFHISGTDNIAAKPSKLLLKQFGWGMWRDLNGEVFPLSSLRSHPLTAEGQIDMTHVYNLHWETDFEPSIIRIVHDPFLSLFYSKNVYIIPLPAHSNTLMESYEKSESHYCFAEYIAATWWHFYSSTERVDWLSTVDDFSHLW